MTLLRVYQGTRLARDTPLSRGAYVCERCGIQHQTHYDRPKPLRCKDCRSWPAYVRRSS